MSLRLLKPPSRENLLVGSDVYGVRTCATASAVLARRSTDHSGGGPQNDRRSIPRVSAPRAPGALPRTVSSRAAVPRRRPSYVTTTYQRIHGPRKPRTPNTADYYAHALWEGIRLANEQSVLDYTVY